jgi:hypothetical protein
MPWCPKCKTEYQEGFTVCSDCNTPLVEKLEENETLLEETETLVPFFSSDEEKVIEKLVKFFQYSDVDCEMTYNEDSGLYTINIPPKKENQAQKLYQAFYAVETSRQINKPHMNEAEQEDEDTSEETEDTDESSMDTDEAVVDTDEDSSSSDDDLTEEYQYGNQEEADASPEENRMLEDLPSDDISSYVGNENDSSVYVMKADEYKDLSGSVWMFLITGIGGLLFVLLDILQIIKVFSGLIPDLVLGAMFLSFIYIAMNTNKKAKKIQAEIDAENELTEKINEWLKLNVTGEFLSSIKEDNISEELNYIKITDTVKEMLIKEFGHQNLAYLDHLIEEYYNDNFENGYE